MSSWCVMPRSSGAVCAKGLDAGTGSISTAKGVGGEQSDLVVPQPFQQIMTGQESGSPTVFAHRRLVGEVGVQIPLGPSGIDEDQISLGHGAALAGGGMVETVGVDRGAGIMVQRSAFGAVGAVDIKKDAASDDGLVRAGLDA